MTLQRIMNILSNATNHGLPIHTLKRTNPRRRTARGLSSAPAKKRFAWLKSPARVFTRSTNDAASARLLLQSASPRELQRAQASSSPTPVLTVAVCAVKVVCLPESERYFARSATARHVIHYSIRRLAKHIFTHFHGTSNYGNWLDFCAG